MHKAPHTHIRIQLFAIVFRFKYHFIISCFYARIPATSDCRMCERKKNGVDDIERARECEGEDVPFRIVFQLFISLIRIFTFTFIYSTPLQDKTKQEKKKKHSASFCPTMLLCGKKISNFSPLQPRWMNEWCSNAFVYRFNNRHFEWLILFFLHALNSTALC